jgi:hypothetical protein
MKTRMEMIYEFMVALSSNSQILVGADEVDLNNKQAAEFVYRLAEAMVDRYFESLV